MSKMTEIVTRISGVNPRKCMKCGKCTAACPAYEEMDYHPHQFVDMVETGRLEELMDSRGIYMCLSCFACLERCPRSVEPAKLIEAVRLAVIRQQEKNHLKPEAQFLALNFQNLLTLYALCGIINIESEVREHAENRHICVLVRQQHRRHGGCGGRF